MATQLYCIVTGANAGIGREITAGLMRDPGAHVVMACRNMEQCEAVRAELSQLLPGSCECSRSVCVVSPCLPLKHHERQHHKPAHTLPHTHTNTLLASAGWTWLTPSPSAPLRQRKPRRCQRSSTSPWTCWSIMQVRCRDSLHVCGGAFALAATLIKQAPQDSNHRVVARQFPPCPDLVYLP